MKTLLITGFEPFGGETINPAWEAVKALPETVGEYTLHKLEIPTVFGEAPKRVLEQAERLHPEVILCVGQAGGRAEVTPERMGMNFRKARIADNQGNCPKGQTIAEDGPAAYFATVPVEAMAQAIREAGLPGRVSGTAGTFVCNDTLYTLLHRYEGTGTKVGFIHVPYLPEQGSPNLSLQEMVRALIAAIAAIS